MPIVQASKRLSISVASGLLEVKLFLVGQNCSCLCCVKLWHDNNALCIQFVFCLVTLVLYKLYKLFSLFLIVRQKNLHSRSPYQLFSPKLSVTSQSLSVDGDYSVVMASASCSHALCVYFPMKSNAPNSYTTQIIMSQLCVYNQCILKGCDHNVLTGVKNRGNLVLRQVEVVDGSENTGLSPKRLASVTV